MTFDKAAYMRDWRLRHPDYLVANRKYQTIQYKKVRVEVLLHYGGKCVCCGFFDLKATVRGRSILQMDHINGGGSRHRKLGATNLYWWLKQHNFPEGFRVLCIGCNNAIEPGESKCYLHKGEALQ